MRAHEQRRGLLDEPRLDLGRPRGRGSRAHRESLRAGPRGDGRRRRVQGRMTPARRRRAGGRLLLLLVGGLLAGGCVYYPTVEDVGGVRLLPEHGRVVRKGEGALFFVDINSTGMFEDALVRVETPIAKRAQLLTQAGEPLTRITVPPTTLTRLHSGGERVALFDLTRELKAGEVVIVTLFFEKSGALGVVSPVE